MIIRPFNEDDFADIVDIYAKSKLDELKFEEKDVELIPLIEDQKRLTEFQESDVYVYEENRILGYGALFGSEIRSLFVTPESRGRAVGKHLLEYLISLVEGPVILHVVASNTPAKKLYEKYGFKVVGEFEATYNNVIVHANKMVRT